MECRGAAGLGEPWPSRHGDADRSAPGSRRYRPGLVGAAAAPAAGGATAAARCGPGGRAVLRHAGLLRGAGGEPHGGQGGDRAGLPPAGSALPPRPLPARARRRGARTDAAER